MGQGECRRDGQPTRDHRGGHGRPLQLVEGSLGLNALDWASPSAGEQLDELQAIVETFDMDEDVRADLQEKLATAGTSLAAGRTRVACKVLRSESGSGLTTDLAAVLIERASGIRSVLACG